MTSWMDALPLLIVAFWFLLTLALMAHLGSGKDEKLPRVITEPEPKIVPPRLARPPLFLSTARPQNTLKANTAVSRNAKCPCGSGKKAKKCCQPIAIAIQESRTRRVANSAVRRGIGRIQSAGGALESAVLVERPELLPVEAGEVREVRPEFEAAEHSGHPGQVRSAGTVPVVPSAGARAVRPEFAVDGRV